MAFSVSPLQRVLDRLFDPGLDSSSGVRRAGVSLLRLLYLGSREFRRDFCWERAATLAFSTVLSLLPIAVLFLAFLPTDKKVDGTKVVLRYLTGTEELQAEIQKTIDQLITDDVFALDTGGGLVAILGLTIAGLALLVSSDRVFGRIWKIHSTRTYFQKFVAFWMLLSTSPFLIALSFYVRDLGDGFVTGDAATVTIYELFIPVVVSCIAFSLIYLFLPPTRVRLVPALVGGCVAGLLWEALKAGFSQYVAQAHNVGKFYGPFGFVPVFLVFVYLTWLIILWGGELSYAWQNYHRLVRDLQLHRHRGQSGRYSPVFLGLHLLEGVVRAFQSGQPAPGVAELANGLTIYVEEFDPVVTALMKDHVLVESAGDRGKFLPARAPGTVPLRTVVTGLLVVGNREDMERVEGDGGAGPESVYCRAREAFLATFDELTLEDLATQSVSQGVSHRETIDGSASLSSIESG